ncbi:two-component system sensor histidine kinase YesM [Neobacillus niacini]|nr:two-component system sensor histidine kinase YesM [Neobacillus niacini]
MFNPFKQFPIRKVYFTIFSIFMSVLIVLMVFVSYKFTINEMQNNTSHYQQKLLREINEQIDIQKTVIEEVTLAMSVNNYLQDYINREQSEYGKYTSIAEINNSFLDIAYSIPIIDSIHVYLEQPPLKEKVGLIRYYSTEKYKSSDWLSPLKNSDSAWLKKHHIDSMQGNTSVISYARKAYFSNDRVGAIIVVNLKLDVFQNIMRDELNSVNRILIDSAGLPVTYVGESKVIDYLKMIEELEKDSNLNLNSDGYSHEQDNFIVWSKLYSNEWLLIEITPWKEVAMSSIELSVILITIGIIAIGIAVIASFFIFNKFIQPINLLLQNMDNFSVANKGVNLPKDYKNEFGVLFSHYEELIRKIMNLYKDLEVEYKQKRKAEVKALQANINPHFLYNTLDQLNWMAIEAEQGKISKVLELTGRMFRIGLSKGESFIPIKQEMDHLESYLQIQQIRLGSQISYEMNIDEAYLDYYMPKLTLQPFVENSIMHGFHHKDEGHITIKIHEVHNHFHIVIKDNGIGIKIDHPMKGQESGGYGIKNVRERLAAYFGESSSVKLFGKEGQGTTVVIKIPKIDYDAMDEVV